MVFNRRDLTKAFSPNKVKKFSKRRSGGMIKPSTSGSTVGTRSDCAQTSIKVIVRVRPHNEKELQDNYKTVVKIIDERMLVFDPKEEENPFFYRGVVQKGRDLLKKQNKELQFVFDRIFDMTSSNVDVYEGSTKELIKSLLDGYNCSVFAYGATGAGKTHTMLGKEGDPGITYRTMAELFAQMELQRDTRDFNLGVSYLEIYNENVQDLLHKVGPLHLREDSRAGVIVAGLKIITIHNADELLSLLAKGNRNRTQHATDANQESSRSHAVFQVYVNVTSKVDGQVKHVKLSMIDLAGSERASATGCTGARFKEGANINKSLLALGNCINNLADGIKHIPYRDSKLTRLLKDSLGGNCQTVMIANISPSSASFEDTYNTLRYANRAKKIKTSVKKNIVSCQMHVSGYIKMVEEQKKELEALKQKLLAYESGSIPVSVAPQNSVDNEEKTKTLLEMSNKLVELYNKKRILNEKILSLESSDKILYCRILYKKAADARLHNLTATVESTYPDEKNASGKSRVNKSLQYFKRQREGIKIQMKSVWEDLCKVEEDLNQLILDIKAKDLHEKLEDKINFLASEVDTSRMQQQFEHAKKISSLQQCEIESVSTMVKMMSSTLQNYYNMMRGGGTITDKLIQEFKQLVKSLEGIRNIKWSDMNINKQGEDFYSTTCLSIQDLENPRIDNMPNALEINSDDEEAQTPSPKNILSKTFDCTPPKYVAPLPVTDEILNSTITISNDAVPVVEDESSSTIETSKLNSTFCLPDNNKGRKRVLSDSKNQVNSRSPAKQAKRISPKNRFESNGPVQNGKENGKSEFPKPTMTAKSIAILNKLKADRMKPLINTTYNGDQSEAKLKAVRDKERRGLTSSHPYQKPTVQKTQTK
ncbi:hypothetical protein TSAR_001688 [Trichomalopsis sarcophagae]|uniref:Kinesin motor domain-containing protein n=1 Tax=Trichomalopsis sarcophagae TaxID=543379 RepID=A0A232F1E4_9HYME|nr:hypothetical protein TSAR_001688 [Trichomalopsis sarcophagae]